jgi:hypothetical protein
MSTPTAAFNVLGNQVMSGHLFSMVALGRAEERNPCLVNIYGVVYAEDERNAAAERLMSVPLGMTPQSSRPVPTFASPPAAVASQ